MTRQSPKSRRGGGSSGGKRVAAALSGLMGWRGSAFPGLGASRQPRATCLSPFGAHDCNAWVDFTAAILTPRGWLESPAAGERQSPLRCAPDLPIHLADAAQEIGGRARASRTSDSVRGQAGAQAPGPPVGAAMLCTPPLLGYTPVW